MRTLFFAVDPNGEALPPVLPPSSFSPSPAPDSSFPFQDDENLNKNHVFYLFPSVHVAGTAFDLVTISMISGLLLLLLLSLVSLSMIFHLRLKSQWSHHLKKFNNLWSIRIILISFVSFWAINEIIRLPFFRQQYIYSFFPPLTLTQEANLCKFYVVLSLGFFEPGILITLLFLLKISIKMRNPNHMTAISTVCFSCLPTLLLQIFFVFLSPLEAQLPSIMHRSFVLSRDAFGNKTVMCSYPLFSCSVFAAFGIAYALGFLLSSWRVISLVINKCIRNRINLLALTIMVTLPLQSLFLALSSLLRPESTVFGGLVLAMFLCVALCAAIGQYIFVIRPIADALDAGGDRHRWNPYDTPQPEISRQNGEDQSS